MAVKKILVVDDSPTERAFLEGLLIKSGYSVVIANSGEEGVEKAKTELPDLILMDVVMPGLNGFQATRAITRGDTTKHIPVFIRPKIRKRTRSGECVKARRIIWLNP